MNSHEVYIHIHQGCFAGIGAIVRLPQCQWSKPDGYGKISQCITTTKHSKAKTECIFLGIYCMCRLFWIIWGKDTAKYQERIVFTMLCLTVSINWYTHCVPSKYWGDPDLAICILPFTYMDATLSQHYTDCLMMTVSLLFMKHCYLEM